MEPYQQLDWTKEEYHAPDWGKDRVCRICGRHWGDGSRNSHGTVGALGRLTHVSETLALAPTAASTTPEDGWNTFQGRLLDISSPLRGEREDAFTLTVCFDSRTLRRLNGRVFGHLGRLVTDGAQCSVTIEIEEQPST